MEVFLYNSTVCRLCGEENDSGSLLYTDEENNQTLCEIINSYLPIKVSDDGELPRTICPGCTIQLEATVEFLNLIINGQKIIRELYQRECEYKKNVLKSLTPEEEAITQKVIYELNTNQGVYQLEHPVSLQVAGLQRPRRRRGRPPKKPKSPEELAEEVAAREREIQEKRLQEQAYDASGKRRRKAPTRFYQAVQGKELERILKEEGVTSGEDSDGGEAKPDEAAEPKPQPKGPEVIGHMETSGELVVVVKGKGRGRPKGRMRPTKEVCAICGMLFSSVGRYMSHVAQHGPVRYQCRQCDLILDTLLELQQHHKESGHTHQRVLPCANPSTSSSSATISKIEPASSDVENIVNDVQMGSLPDLSEPSDFIANVASEAEVTAPDNTSTTNQIDPLSTPVKTDEEAVEVGPKGKVKLKCSHCDKMFSSRQSKSVHYKAVHLGERSFECKECGQTFAYPRSLTLHSISHRRNKANTKRYACDLCGKVLNHPSSVVYHKQAEHAGQRYVCSKCGKRFKHRQLLQRHQLVHSQDRPYSCKGCDASFKTKANLMNHQLLHSGVKKFSCEICKHKFAHKTSLTLHMRWHTGSKPYVCKTCGKSFSQKGNLSEHERIHTGEKPYACTVCARKFTTSSQFRLHARRHQTDRPYICLHCNKRFVSRSAWAAHQKRESGNKPFECAECGRAFVEKWALIKHSRKHTGERPFKCPHCRRAFADLSNLNKHKKQVHKQISLLSQASAITVPPEPTPTIDPGIEPVASSDTLEPVEQEGMQEIAMASDDDEERVIYVAYDVDDDDTAYQILDTEQVAAVTGDVNTKLMPLYQETTMLEEPQLLELADESLDEPQQITMTDEEGNPIQLTMPDGTALAFTMPDGSSVRVVSDQMPLINSLIAQQNQIQSPAHAQVIKIQKEDSMDDVSQVAHYYTIV